MKITKDDLISQNVLVFRDGRIVGLVQEIDLETMDMTVLVPDPDSKYTYSKTEGFTSRQYGKYDEVEDKADFVIIGDLTQVPDTWKQLV